MSVRSISGEAGGPAVLKTSAIKAGRFDPRESKPILPADLPRAKCPVAADSIIISRMNTPALVGDVGYVEKDFDSLFLPDRLGLHAQSVVLALISGGSPTIFLPRLEPALCEN